MYNLPHNPMNYKSFKCNYIKARVETSRMDFIHSQSQTFQFKIDDRREASTAVMLPNVTAQLPNPNYKEGQAAKWAIIAKRPVSNAYLRNQKLV